VEADSEEKTAENPVNVHSEPDSIKGQMGVFRKFEKKIFGNEEAEKNTEKPHADI